MSDVVRQIVAAELARPVMPEACALAEAILEGHGEAVEAILFYGSCLRSGDASGLLDFYVLVRDSAAWRPSQPWRGRLLQLLPPDVEQWSARRDGRTIRAKVAVMGIDQFARRVGPDTRDTSIWARFCQPVALLHARDAAARHRVEEIVSNAVTTAALWAARLGPETGTPADYWRALFAATYGAELRAERSGRANEVHASAAARYDVLLVPAWERAAVLVETGTQGRVRPLLPDGSRHWALAVWEKRRRAGKRRNMARLVKAAFTFEGGADYLAWKVERHSGVAVPLTPWQRRHPILAAPLLFWRLRRAGAVR